LNVESVTALVRRHRLLIVAAAVIAGVLGLLVSSRGSSSFTATTTVVLYPQDPASDLAPTFNQVDRERYAANESVLAVGPDVAARVMKQINTGTVDSLRAAIAVTHPLNTDLLVLTATSSNPTAAMAIANAFADGYLEERKARDQAIIQQQLDAVAATIDQVSKTITDLSQQIQAAALGSSTEAQLTSLRNAQNAALTTKLLEGSNLKSKLTLNRGSGDVIERPTKAVEQSGLKPSFAGVGGVLLGLLIGLGAAAGMEQLAPLVRSRDDLDLPVPVAAEVPFDRRVQDDAPGAPSIIVRGDERFAESVRSLRTRIRLLAQDQAVRRVVITGPRAGAGATTIAVNLAAALASADTPTVLVDADLRHPRADRLLAFDGNRSGLAQMVLDQDRFAAGTSVPLATTGIDQLRLLPAGAAPSNPSEVIASAGLERLLSRLSEWGSFVVVDAPPVLEYADAPVLAAAADLVVLVVAEGATRRADLRAAMAALQGTQLPRLTLVLNQVRSG
jgi:capsular exopolysaccharide synthesis family protein